MRLLTKAEACRELRLTLSTLNPGIAPREMYLKREPRGRRQRAYVMLDDDLPSAVETPQPELVMAQERIQDLEAQVGLLQGQLEQERQRKAELVDDVEVLMHSCERQRP